MYPVAVNLSSKMTQEVMLETNANAKDVPKNNLNNNSVEFIKYLDIK